MDNTVKKLTFIIKNNLCTENNLIVLHKTYL